ncbi:MAG: hypothetical protein JSU70_00430 [Phycisphaerales bacterium]|nr:MAG: hypothetical protein JSU70_00430 [Phycisphaerales bacterium]
MRYRFRSGLSLLEFVITMTVGAVLTLVVGVLLVSGQRAWNHIYTSVRSKVHEDARAVTIAFGSIGRKSNRLDYTIYTANGGTYTPAEPETLDEEVVAGDAVEFRFWDVELDQADSHQLMDVTKQATAYALFYLDDDKLKIDYGPYPPGAVPPGGGSRNTADIKTITLAENVVTDPNMGPFSHTTTGGQGQGSVRMNVSLTDPEDGKTVTVKTATSMRNVWPR